MIVDELKGREQGLNIILEKDGYSTTSRDAVISFLNYCEQAWTKIQYFKEQTWIRNAMLMWSDYLLNTFQESYFPILPKINRKLKWERDFIELDELDSYHRVRECCSLEPEEKEVLTSRIGDVIEDSIIFPKTKKEIYRSRIFKELEAVPQIKNFLTQEEMTAIVLEISEHYPEHLIGE